MDLKRLRAFHSICEYGSIQRAARQLKLTSAAVSIQLKKLEREVGAALFDHHPNKLVLTTKGCIFAGEVKSIFAIFDRAIATLSQGSDDYAMKLSLSLANDASRFFIPRIGSLIQNKPDLRINILLRSSSETLSLVQSGEIHFGIGRYQKVPAGIQKVALFEDRILLIFLSKNPPRWVRRIRLEALATCRLFLLTRNSATRKLIDASFMRKGIGVDNVIEVSTCQASIEFVRLGLGIGLVHKICVSGTEDKDIGVMDMSKFFGRAEVSLIYRSQMHLTPVHRRVIAALSKNKVVV
jgi:LysR family nitrogen assimilation transcriptional regulator